MLGLIDRKICKAFSNAAIQYDVLSSMHREIGRELIAKIVERDCSMVLDVGMGTGWLTNRLVNIFPDARVVGMDFASGMLCESKKRAGDFQRVQACAEQMPFHTGSFDLIVSNLAYQWARDLPIAFKQCHHILKPQRKLCVTMFGYNTFKELFVSLEESAQGKSLVMNRLARKENIYEAMSVVGFHHVKIQDEHIKVHFPDMMALIKWIKNIGANALPRDFFVGKDFINRANNYYQQHFHEKLGIYATLEVIWIEGTASSDLAGQSWLGVG